MKETKNTLILRRVTLGTYLLNLVLLIITVTVGMSSLDTGGLTTLINISNVISIAFTILLFVLVIMELSYLSKDQTAMHRKRRMATDIIVLVCFVIATLIAVIENFTTTIPLAVSIISTTSNVVGNIAFWYMIVENIIHKY
ncbi:hypothetical protein [Aminicella lysinilytica]|uniref:Uncharacterized protein n=1 Tax=Aminicella lysinilytica TaxID=433323 RepID=A0A4R6Q8F3_9FIRM|nr:hypothetical protein [Aminicella lysinilytica]TDP57943.1 hypothetical protein EV211_10953 [Aminicella lysinilytica]